MVWSENVTFTILYKSAQIITVWVSSITGEQFLCSCIYASNFQTERRNLWSDLISNNTQFASHGVPWIIMGDFNETLSSSEHSIGLDPQNQSGMQDFQSTVSTCNLTDLASSGSNFTWTNSQPDNPIAKNWTEYSSTMPGSHIFLSLMLTLKHLEFQTTPAAESC